MRENGLGKQGAVPVGTTASRLFIFTSELTACHAIYTSARIPVHPGPGFLGSSRGGLGSHQTRVGWGTEEQGRGDSL